MVHRHTPPEGAAAFNMYARGVYEEPYTIKGNRVWYAVDSNGEQIAFRTIKAGRDPAGIIEDLWAELDTWDPIQPHDRAPTLRIIR